jgi:hypothetical protein
MPNQIHWALLEDVMDTEKQPHDETITVEKPAEDKPAQTITSAVGDLVSSSATLIAHSAEAVVGRIKDATVGSPPKKRKTAKKRVTKSKKSVGNLKDQLTATKKTRKKKAAKKATKTTPKRSKGKTMAKKAKKKTAKSAAKKTAKKTAKKKAKR